MRTDLTSHPCGRYANLAELSEEDRENKLEVKTVEYLVHGIFARSEKGMGEGRSAFRAPFGSTSTRSWPRSRRTT